MHSKSKVQWWAFMAIICIVFTSSACEKDCNCPEDTNKPEEYPSLKIENQISDDRYIGSVKLVGYEFNDLNITRGNSQTFILDNGMPGGYEAINVTVSYRTPYIPFNSRSISVNFSKGEITTISLKGCSGAEGCPGYYLEYSP